MTCAKARVFVTLTHPDGRQWIGENWCRNPQPACPREPGEDYTKCRTVCDQVGHAEVDALRRAGADAAGCTATLRGHTYFCQPCQHAMFDAGVRFIGREGGAALVMDAAHGMRTDAPCEAAKPASSSGRNQQADPKDFP